MMISLVHSAHMRQDGLLFAAGEQVVKKTIRVAYRTKSTG